MAAVCNSVLLHLLCNKMQVQEVAVLCVLPVHVDVLAINHANIIIIHDFTVFQVTFSLMASGSTDEDVLQNSVCLSVLVAHCTVRVHAFCWKPFVLCRLLLQPSLPVFVDLLPRDEQVAHI